MALAMHFLAFSEISGYLLPVPHNDFFFSLSNFSSINLEVGGHFSHLACSFEQVADVGFAGFVHSDLMRAPHCTPLEARSFRRAHLVRFELLTGLKVLNLSVLVTTLLPQRRAL